MNIKNFKKKCIALSLVLILTGALISAAGFWTAGFSYNRFKERPTKDAWYQTIHTDSGNLWYGIDLGNGIHLFTIGDSD